MKLANGQIIYSLPNFVDTDGDGLSDGEEIIMKRKYYNIPGMPSDIVNSTSGIYFEMISDPNIYNLREALVYQSSRYPGQINYYEITKEMTEQEKVAPDMTYCDYYDEQLIKIGGAFPYLVDTADFYGNNPLLIDWQLFFKLVINNNEMEEVSLDMIDHFMNGNGSDYRNETLTAFTYKHESTQRYINGSKNRIIEELRLSNGNLNSLQFFQPPTEEYDSSQFLIDMKNIGNPRYNTTDDLRNGLTLCINDTWGNRIEIKNYKYDGKRFSGTIHYTVYDHFGLDPEDMEKQSF